MVRSLLECELSNERLFKVPPFGIKADIVSLDPGSLSLMSAMSMGLTLDCTDSLHRLKLNDDADPSPPPLTSTTSSAKTLATKLVRIVSPNSSNRNISNINCKASGTLQPNATSRSRRETVVRFSANNNTMVLAPQSNNQHRKDANLKLSTNGSNLKYNYRNMQGRTIWFSCYVFPLQTCGKIDESILAFPLNFLLLRIEVCLDGISSASNPGMSYWTIITFSSSIWI